MGAGADALLARESGGHRWQRVPPTEKRGRVHTSTVTVAVLPEPTHAEITIPESEIEWFAVRGSGPGGQHRNMTASAILVRHRPTGIEARCQSERSQHRNRASALAVLAARVWGRMQGESNADRAADRKAQIGSGMRGDKRRTIRERDGRVTDHVDGRRWRYEDYVAGKW